jgi:hypothetical protein
MSDRKTALEVSRPPKRNWRVGGNESLYALSIIDDRFGNSSEGGPQGAIDRAGVEVTNALADTRRIRDFDEFIFKMNPKNLQLDEPAAVTIIPTQGGSQFIEHQGQIYKNITIQGTTGFRPNRLISPSILGVRVGGPGGSPDNSLERTGFDDLIDLRNLFRRYWSIKGSDADRAPHTVMVWQNGKEGEFYVVEPMSFNTQRTSASPYTFEYNITLRTIERLDIRRSIKKDSAIATNGKGQLRSRLKEASIQLRQGFVITQALIDATVGLGIPTINDFFSAADEIIIGLTGISNTTAGDTAWSVSKNRVSEFKQNGLELLERLNLYRAQDSAYRNSGIMTRSAIAANQAKKMAWAAARVEAEESLYFEQTSVRTSRKQGAYINPVTGAPRTGGDPSYLANSPISEATNQSVVNSGETIRGAAKRLLGNTNLWKQLVIINDLRAPYLSPNGDGKSVLRPGDTILFPTAGSSAPETAVSSDRTAIEVQKDSLTQRLGRDIRIVNPTAAGGDDVYDFAINARGDLATIEGVDNLEQAAELKFSTEPGSLPVHPFFGVLAPIGEKLRTLSIIQFQTNARASLLSDSRIEDVVSFDVRAEGNVLYVRTTLRIRGADAALSVSFEARR